ncbi:hypothetical protein B0H63DRAFT_454794 [Podospora didyma]|uniref:Uncharacterized protein n=1 Tax=Podospora didyma TaxID=330526 RepID=A0AAE0K792_9PEZI|nr:hypothetical protein B0H63DRAFT_454794 [Podospora didyma]
MINSFGIMKITINEYNRLQKEYGGYFDSNLLDTLLLNSKPDSHGFTLARHPYIMEHMKKCGICLEVYPIPNKIPGLTPRVGGHAMYNLLANDVRYTVSSDNRTLFRLRHACMTEKEFRSVKEIWQGMWDEFL